MRHEGFRRLWLANAAGDVGQQFGVLALSVTAVEVLRASTLQVSVVAALGSAAFLVFGMPSGVWVDRWPKRRVLIVADLVRAISIASVPVAYVLDLLTVGQLMVVSAVTGIAALFFNVAHTSVLPGLVGRDRVSEASARLQTTDTVLQVTGPGLAGQVLRLVAAPLVYAITAVMHLVSAGFVATMPFSEPAAKGREHEPFWAAMRAGVGFVARNVVLRTFLGAGALINLGAGVYAAVFAVYVLRDLDISVAVFGLISSIGGLGGVLGSLAGLRLKRALGSIRAVVVCYGLLGVAFALVPATGVLPVRPEVLLTASSVCFGALLVMASISSTGINARVTPSHLMGRVTASRRFVTMGAVPLGSLLGGVVATTTSNTVALWLAAALALSSVAVFAGSPLARMRELPSEWCCQE